VIIKKVTFKATCERLLKAEKSLIWKKNWPALFQVLGAR